MNLSQNLWNQAENYKQELELALSSAIEKDISAVTLSKRVSKYLNDFDSLKKDYKQKYGKAVDIHDCEYRSIRLARSEINMAYRTAEQTRWQQMDFILGYEIKLSHSHPCHDICDELKGRYPKDFKWVGWHPNDMCYVVPIIKSEDQWWEDEDKRGTDNDEITDVPQQFKNWVANNQDRIARAEQRGTLPYFVRDNRERVKQAVKQGEVRSGDYILNPSGTPSGDGVDKVGRFLDIPVTKKEAVSRLQALATDYDHEEAYVFLPDGRVYYKVGVLNKVPFTSEGCKLFEGGVLMHNHPSETFSPDDIAFGIKNKLNELRVITPDKQYRAVIPNEMFGKYEYKDVVDMVENVKDSLSLRMKEFNSKKYMLYLMNFHNYAMLEFFRVKGIKYIISHL